MSPVPPQRPRIAVTGMGVVTSLGAGKDENWKKLVQGQSGIRAITRFDTAGLKTTMSGAVDFVLPASASAQALTAALAEIAIDEALVQARLGQPGYFPGPLVVAAPPVEPGWAERLTLAARSGVVPATYTALCAAAKTSDAVHPRFLFGWVGEQLAERFGTQGAPIALTTACASGATAIHTAVEALRFGQCDTALAVGTEGSMQAEALIRFSLLSALSTQNDRPETASKPFSKNRDGFVLAEGAAALVLETEAHARRRGADILGYVVGCGEQADHFHRTRSSPDGHAMIGAVRRALSNAGLEPEAIDYINAHGTSTPENDKMEFITYKDVFGDRAGLLPLSSNKSMIGHTITAAGAVEAVFSLLTLAQQTLPPTINYDQPDPALPLDVVPHKARGAQIRTVMSNSFGFGGQNASLIFQTAE